MKKLSVITIITCTLVVIVVNFSLKLYKLRDRIIESDVKHYYAWIPAIFVYKDISLSFLDINPDGNKDYFVTVDRFNGKLYFKTTMGVALMQAPFVLPVHYYLKYTGGTADGFSIPYKIALIISSIFYYMMTLWILRYLLLRKMKIGEVSASLTILIVAVATNLMVYVVREPAMSHVYSFFSIGLLVYLINKFFGKPDYQTGILAGIMFGLITLIRPVNALVGIVFILWDVTNWNDLKNRILFYFKNPGITFSIIIAFVLMWIPQFMYYKFLSGHYAFIGYGTGEKFFFNNPQFINNLFSYRKGWFLYTPSMLLAVLGLFPLYKSYRNIFWTVLTILFLLVYINSSWYAWWFGGGFGQRAYIDIYMLLAFPVAALLKTLYSHKVALKISTVLLVFIFVFHNGFQVTQYINGAIHWIGMTKEAYWDSFGRKYPSVRFSALLEEPDMKLAKQGIYPKPKDKSRTKEEWISYIEERFRKDSNMMDFLQKKAIKENQPLDTIIHNDAKYVYKVEFE